MYYLEDDVVTKVYFLIFMLLCDLTWFSYPTLTTDDDGTILIANSQNHLADSQLDPTYIKNGSFLHVVFFYYLSPTTLNESVPIISM